MKFYDGFLPKEPKPGKTGYYPVTNAKEWDELPEVYKAMEWFPVEVYNPGIKAKEMTVAEYVEFDVVHLLPYKVRATVRVHVQDVQKILFCHFKDPQCHLYSVSGVVFANGVRWHAKWFQDTTTGAFAIYAGGKSVGTQGGYMEFIPCQIEKTENGFKWTGFDMSKNRCHKDFMNPFVSMTHD